MKPGATLTAEEALTWARGGEMICSCGRALLPIYDDDGNRLGVTHTPEDEDHHLGLWSGLFVDLVEQAPPLGSDGLIAAIVEVAPTLGGDGRDVTLELIEELVEAGAPSYAAKLDRLARARLQKAAEASIKAMYKRYEETRSFLALPRMAETIPEARRCYRMGWWYDLQLFPRSLVVSDPEGFDCD